MVLSVRCGFFFVAMVALYMGALLLGLSIFANSLRIEAIFLNECDMDRPLKSIHGEWSSRWAFILAATGAAVGLANIWKFPYITGEYGGGAFVLVYLICIGCIGLPVMMA